MNKLNEVRSYIWKDGKLYLLDQTRLPAEVVMEEQTSIEQVWDSIKQLKVRGAPAIGVVGAYGLAIGMREYSNSDPDVFMNALHRNAAYLDSSRPTAVNLHWALKRVLNAVETSGAADSPRLFKILLDTASAIHAEDAEHCRCIGMYGVSLIIEGMGIFTHCNAGRLATSEYGTATAPMYLAHERGISFRVYSGESRPLLQGSRLTAWELQQAGIDVYTITDNMAAYVMNRRLVDMVIVGADRVAANGDTANKIGTMGVAILARHFRLPFYIACPGSTIDLDTPSGLDIVIEERSPEEVTFIGERRMAPEGIKVCNPAFDVTPNELITGIITDRGIIGQPYAQNLRHIFGA